VVGPVAHIVVLVGSRLLVGPVCWTDTCMYVTLFASLLGVGASCSAVCPAVDHHRGLTLHHAHATAAPFCVHVFVPGVPVLTIVWGVMA
jgi:hypothetical protein